MKRFEDNAAKALVVSVPTLLTLIINIVAVIFISSNRHCIDYIWYIHIFIILLYVYAGLFGVIFMFALCFSMFGKKDGSDFHAKENDSIADLGDSNLE
jgi:hypothetical protein